MAWLHRSPPRPSRAEEVRDEKDARVARFVESRVQEHLWERWHVKEYQMQAEAAEEVPRWPELALCISAQPPKYRQQAHAERLRVYDAKAAAKFRRQREEAARNEAAVRAQLEMMRQYAHPPWRKQSRSPSPTRKDGPRAASPSPTRHANHQANRLLGRPASAAAPTRSTTRSPTKQPRGGASQTPRASSRGEESHPRASPSVRKEAVGDELERLEARVRYLRSVQGQSEDASRQVLSINGTMRRAKDTGKKELVLAMFALHGAKAPVPEGVRAAPPTQGEEEAGAAGSDGSPQRAQYETLTVDTSDELSPRSKTRSLRGEAMQHFDRDDLLSPNVAPSPSHLPGAAGNARPALATFGTPRGPAPTTVTSEMPASPKRANSSITSPQQHPSGIPPGPDQSTKESPRTLSDKTESASDGSAPGSPLLQSQSFFGSFNIGRKHDVEFLSPHASFRPAHNRRSLWQQDHPTPAPTAMVSPDANVMIIEAAPGLPPDSSDDEELSEEMLADVVIPPELGAWFDALPEDGKLEVKRKMSRALLKAKSQGALKGKAKSVRLRSTPDVTEF